MGSQPGGWRERRNAADQLGGIRAWSPRAKVAGNLVGYALPLRLRAGVPPRGRSWLAVQDPHDVLGGGDRRYGDCQRKRQLLEGRHAENGSTAGQERSLDDEAANREGPGDLRPRRPSEGFGTWHAISRSQVCGAPRLRSPIPAVCRPAELRWLPQRQPRQICQMFGEGRFSAAGVSEYRNSLHLARSVNMSPRRALRVKIDEHRQA